MKIGVNGRFLTKPYTGIGQYTKNLFSHLKDKKNEYVLVVPEKISDEILSSFPKNVRVKIIPEHHAGTKGMKKTWWEQISLAKFLEKENVDIAFFPYPSNPWSHEFYHRGIKTIVTVHDCIPYKLKEYRRGILSHMYHSQSKKALNKADLILTVSNNSKKEISTFCDVPLKKIEVIYNDASDIYKEKIDEKFAEKVLKKFGVEAYKYLIYVGGYDRRKNVSELIREYSLFAKKYHDISLVLTGGKLLADELYKSFDEKQSVHGKLIRTGFLDEADLKALYCKSLSFVNLSEEEGFNIPIVEAANCGTAIIVSDTAVHREIAGNNVIFFKSGKDLLKDLVEKILKEKGKYSEKSSLLGKKYSWDASAKKFVNMICSITVK